jgi:hypothetical protein
MKNKIPPGSSLISTLPPGTSLSPGIPGPAFPSHAIRELPGALKLGGDPFSLAPDTTQKIFGISIFRFVFIYLYIYPSFYSRGVYQGSTLQNFKGSTQIHREKMRTPS